jgi:LPLT family lysophospholipid transporter-like MFS transporter
MMMAMNALKVVGVLLPAGLQAHPLLALGGGGRGAAAYAPAKYGLVTELVGRASWWPPMAGSR